jgi:hypothetical protein
MKAHQDKMERIGKTVHSPANLKTSEQLSQELKDGKVKVTVDAPPTQPGDQKGVKPTPAPAHKAKSGDQSDVKPASQNATQPEGKPTKEEKAKKAKKISPTYTTWKTIPNQPVNGIITIIPGGKPKIKDAARRFQLYKNGMTVGEYLTVTKENGIRNALANADIRWDIAAKLITVTVK